MNVSHDDFLGDEMSHELSEDAIKTPFQTSATWEHKDLAQVKVRVLRGHEDTVKSCHFCVGGTKILTASQDETVLLWDFTSGKAIKKYKGHSAAVSRAKADSSGTRFISTGWDKKVILWDTETARVLWTGNHGGIVTCGSWSHDDKFIVTGSDLDMTVRIWDSQTGALVQTLQGLHKSTVTNAFFSNNDDRLFTTSMDYTSKVWDLKSKTNTITLEGHKNVVSDASCTKNERHLATVSWDKSIRLWDLSTGEYRSKGSSVLQKAHEGSISSCDFSEDGSLLVTGGYDHQVLLWDVDNMVLKLRLQGHVNWVEDVCFSPDQKWIISCGKDATARLWNIENAKNIIMVKETNRSIGLHLRHCTRCDKPFSTAKASESVDSVESETSSVCVFCRFQASNKKETPFDRTNSLIDNDDDF